MGIPYPKEYGGAGLDALSYAIAVEELVLSLIHIFDPKWRKLKGRHLRGAVF